MDLQRYSVRLELSHEKAFELWWKSMEDLGWNRSPKDLATYLTASQTKALLLGVRTEGDTKDVPVGHVLAAIYMNKTGWIGLFVVQPQYRGRSYGRALLEAALGQFDNHDTAVVGLDSVAEQKSTYERRGFVASRLGKIRCMSYISSPNPVSVSNQGSVLDSPNLRMIDLREIPSDLLSKSDYDHTGFKRDTLWDRGLLERADCFGLALIESERCTSTEDIHGWTIVRQTSQGSRLGPVYARDRTASRALILAAMQTSGVRNKVENMRDIGSNICLVAEVWGGNKDAVSVFEELGWHCTGVDYHRMWLHGNTTQQQSEDGLAQKGMFAIFDAVVG